MELKKKNVIKLELVTLSKRIFDQMQEIDAARLTIEQYKKVKDKAIGIVVQNPTAYKRGGLFFILPSGAKVSTGVDAPDFWLERMKQEDERIRKLPQIFIR